MLSVLLSACATVEHRYAMDASADEIRGATHEAASRLGWTADLATSGRIHLTASPGGFLVAEPLNGALLVESAPRDTGLDSLLAATSRQVLTGEVGAPITPRSLPLTIALDVLMPAAGTLYLGPADPGGLAFGGASFGVNLALRLVLDAVGAEMFWLSTIDANRALFVGSAIGALVLNRVLALILDVKSVRFRNGLAARGVALPTADALWREHTARATDVTR